MSFKDAQKEVDDWIKDYPEGYWEPLEILGRITEEQGELAREINHLYGPKKKKDTEDENSISNELGDVLFSIICLANREKIDLDDSFGHAMDKCYGRDRDRFVRHQK